MEQSDEICYDIEFYAKELAKAKENVMTLLYNEGMLIDLHNIVYWASKVEECRKKIKEQL